jgi:D-beta-D-heptose 7-phosphate kinase/D-beta-D-heptose 1-phosphate adenosyltransferase
VKDGRIVTEQELVELVHAERADGRTIAFANGCFDLLHVGHVRYLAGAAAGPTVWWSRSTMTRSWRGSKRGRPIMPAHDRAEIVAALRGSTGS